MTSVSLDSISDLLIDTCFLVDSREFFEEFGNFLREVKEKEISTYSIDLVRAEFIRARTPTEIDAKLKYFESVFDAVLPIEKFVSENNGSKLVEILEFYGQDLDGVQVTDIYLGACLRQYKSLYL